MLIILKKSPNGTFYTDKNSPCVKAIRPESDFKLTDMTLETSCRTTLLRKCANGLKMEAEASPSAPKRITDQHSDCRSVSLGSVLCDPGLLCIQFVQMLIRTPAVHVQI